MHRLKGSIPEDILLKIDSEYFPAPDREKDSVFFSISIIQQCTGTIWIYMVTFVTPDGNVIPTATRKYPRSLEHFLSLIAKSLEFTFLNKSNILFESSCTNCFTAGLIGPLTRKQSLCRDCHWRKFSSMSLTTKDQFQLYDKNSSANNTNVGYIEDLIWHALKRIRTQNRISKEKISNYGTKERKLWIKLQKPRMPISKILHKASNRKKNIF